MRSSKPWSPPAWLEPAFIYIAFLVAAVAAISLVLWLFVTFFVPFNLYTKSTDEISLPNGQILQIEYPNLILAGDTPIYITLILYGESNSTVPADFLVTIPAGLTVIDPIDHEKGKSLSLNAMSLGSSEKPEQIRIGMINSRSIIGLFPLLYAKETVEVESSLLGEKQNINIGVETIFWMSARGIVNNTINEKSTLILLVTGFLSGAGTFVLQNIKTHRDRAREDWQKKEDDFRNRLEKDYLSAINLFLSFDKKARAEDWEQYERLIRPSGWEYKMPALVLERLSRHENADARQTAESLYKLCDVLNPRNEFGKTDESIHLRSLLGLCELVLVDYPHNKEINDKEISCLLITYKRWHDLKPLATDLLHNFVQLTKNLPIISKILVPDKDGLLLLRDSNIDKIIETHITKTKDDSPEDKAAKNIHSQLALDIKWRPIWAGNERKLSTKTLRWLSRHRYEETINNDFFIGSEYAELDNKLQDFAIQHPVFEQLNGAFSAIVFGDEGMGKTASALQLMKTHQELANSESRESKVFPIYAPFESGVDIKEWMVEKVSRALIDFTADNPRRFLTSPDSQKTAMGRLMLRHSQDIEALRLNFFSSPFNNHAADLEQVLEYIRTLKYVMPSVKLSKEEILNLLYMARPDIFQQVCFLWDIRSAVSHEDAINHIKELEGLVLPLARQNLFIKIFAPLAIKKSLGKLEGFHSTNDDLIWSEYQIREFIEMRIKKFDLLWERGIDDPLGLFVTATSHSPRQTIRLLIRLMDYVETNLQETEKIKKDTFEQIRLGLTVRK